MIRKSKLGEIVEFQRGYDLTKENMDGGEYPVEGSTSTIGFHSKYKSENGIVIGRSGTIGKPRLILGKYWPHNTALFTTNLHGNDLKYVYYLLSNFDIGSMKTGSNIPTLNRNDLYPLELLYEDDIEKQKRIASILKNLDDKIDNNNKINAELESLAKTIYDYWFLQFEFPNEEGKPYKSSGGKMVWNEELKREIPEGWMTTTLGDITKCHDSERIPLSGKQRESMRGNIPYYGATGIMGYVNKAIFNGDYVLIAEDGSIMDEKGHPIIQRVSGEMWINNHTHVLEPLNGYSCRLLMMFLKDVYVPTIKTGSIQMKITQDNLNKIKLIDIPREIRYSMDDYLLNIDRKILEIEKENQKLASLRDFLLPLLMNGQVGFKKDGDE